MPERNDSSLTDNHTGIDLTDWKVIHIIKYLGDELPEERTRFGVSRTATFRHLREAVCEKWSLEPVECVLRDEEGCIPLHDEPVLGLYKYFLCVSGRDIATLLLTPRDVRWQY